MTTPKAKINLKSPLRRLYTWTLLQCEKPYADWFLGFFSFFESIVIPIPTDPLFLVRATATPKRALWIAAYVTLASVLGGIIGYFLGAYFWDQINQIFFQYIISETTFEIIKKKLTENTFLFLFLGGFSPLPFKVTTITAGSLSLPFLPFFLGSLFGRAIRFFSLAILVYFFGKQIHSFIDKHLERLFLILSGALLLLLSYRLFI